MALTYNNQFDTDLRKLIDAEIVRLKDNLGLGASVQSYDDYRNQVGQLQGLNKALDLCDEAQTIMNTR